MDEDVHLLPLHARFGDTLDLIGYSVEMENVVNAQELPASVTTCWRSPEQPDRIYDFVFFFTRQDGAIVGLYDGGTATSLWYPTRSWAAGETVCMETPSLPIGRLRDVMVAVKLPLTDPWAVENRLRPITAVGDGSVETFEEDSLLKLFSFPTPERGGSQ